jgi:hypothetical protein
MLGELTMSAEEGFNAVTEDFLHEKNLENASQIVTQNRVSDFLSRSEVLTYLTRTDITFDAEDEPVLPSIYERDFYAACRTNEEHRIPYRGEQQCKFANVNPTDAPFQEIVEHTSFYKSGTLSQDFSFLIRTLQERIDQTKSEDSEHTNVFLVSNGGVPHDPYGVRNILRSISRELFPSLSSVLTSMQPQTERTFDAQIIQKMLFTSEEKEIQDGYGRNITLPNNGHSFLIFPIDKHDHDLLIAAAVDNSKKKIPRIAIMNSYDDKSYYNEMEDRLNLDAKANLLEKFKISDFSHNLQIESDGDINCALYATNFSRSLIETLREDPEAREMFADPLESDEKVFKKIKDGMMARLPEYYMQNAEGEYYEVNASSKRLAHLRQRWGIGSAILRQRAASQKNIQNVAEIGPAPSVPPVERAASSGPTGTEATVAPAPESAQEGPPRSSTTRNILNAAFNYPKKGVKVLKKAFCRD